MVITKKRRRKRAVQAPPRPRPDPTPVRIASEASVFFMWTRLHTDLYAHDPDCDNMSIFERRMRSVHFRDSKTDLSYCVGPPPKNGQPCWADYSLDINPVTGDAYRIDNDTKQREPCVWHPGSIRVKTKK